MGSQKFPATMNDGEHESIRLLPEPGKSPLLQRDFSARQVMSKVIEFELCRTGAGNLNWPYR